MIASTHHRRYAPSYVHILHSCMQKNVFIEWRYRTECLARLKSMDTQTSVIMQYSLLAQPLSKF